MFSVQFICCHEMNPTCTLDPDRRRIVFLVELLRSSVCLLNTFANGAMAFISPLRQYGSSWLLYFSPVYGPSFFTCIPMLYIRRGKLRFNCGVLRAWVVMSGDVPGTSKSVDRRELTEYRNSIVGAKDIQGILGTVRPWEARFLGNWKTRAAQNRAS